MEKVISIGEKLADEFGNKKPSEDTGEFWKKAGHRKNNGFYVDFENGQWIAPTSFENTEYRRTLTMVSPFLRLLGFIEEIKHDDYETKLILPGGTGSADATGKDLQK